MIYYNTQCHGNNRIVKAKTSEVYPNVIKITSVDNDTQFLTLFLKTSEVLYTQNFIVDLTLRIHRVVSQR